MTYYYGTTPDIYKLRALKWTTEPPSRKGLYFACQSGIVYWVEVLGNLMVGNPRGADFPLDDFSHWIGPLLIPEPPSEGE